MDDLEFTGNDGSGAPATSTGGGNGLNAAYRQAFNDLLASQTPQARNDAMVRMEQAALAGPEKPLSAPPIGQSAAYKDALARAMNAPTGQARAAAVAEMESLAIMHSDVAAAAAARQADAAVPEGFEPALWVGDLPIPPDMRQHIANMGEFEATREAAAAVGLPKAVWAEGLQQAAAYSHLEGASEEVWNQHMNGVLAALGKTHGPEALPGIVQDGAAYLNALADADPRLARASDLMRASPWAVSQAAQLWRAGVRPGRSSR